jgi:phosphatidylserine/phosphatidylglycerophosphate/cardiolipin synthase-like enzyme
MLAVTGGILIGSSIIYGLYFLQSKEINIDKTEEINSEEMSISYIFSKSDQSTKQKLMKLIDSSHKTIDIAVYTVTDSEIISRLCIATKRGVKVRLISDRDQTNNMSYQNKAIQKLLHAGIPVKINTHKGLMHLKLLISDNKIVASGSYNFTKRAEKDNDEVMIFINNKKFALEWSEIFEELWEDTNNYVPYSKEHLLKNA